MRCTSLKSTVGWVLLNVCNLPDYHHYKENFHHLGSFLPVPVIFSPGVLSFLISISINQVFFVLGVNISGIIHYVCGLPWWLSWSRIHLQCRRPGLDPWVGKIPWRREQLPAPVFWLGEFHGPYSPWGHKELDLTERLSLSTGPKERLMRTVGFTRSLCSFLLLPFVSSNQTAWSHPIPFSPCPFLVVVCGWYKHTSLLQIFSRAVLCTYPESQT